MSRKIRSGGVYTAHDVAVPAFLRVTSSVGQPDIANFLLWRDTDDELVPVQTPLNCTDRGCLR
jgi:hypothetical protein